MPFRSRARAHPLAALLDGCYPAASKSAFKRSLRLPNKKKQEHYLSALPSAVMCDWERKPYIMKNVYVLVCLYAIQW